MEIKSKSHKNTPKNKKDSKSKRVSKTWLAMLKNAGTGKINDMDAVLK